MRNQNTHFAESRKKVCLVFSILLLTLGIVACSRSDPPTNPATETHVPETDPSLTTPAGAKAVDTDITRAIDDLIDSSELASARWGVNVTSLKDNRIVYERNGDRLFTPASNMKLFPTGVALELLGADYRWRTSVYAAAPPDAAGTINGDVVLYGRGAPDLVSIARKNATEDNSLERLATDLYNRGVRHIRGNVIGDESYFRGEPLGDGWQWNDVQWYFGAEASALSINNNETSINVLPPEKAATTPVIRTGDTTGYVTVENRMTSAAPGERMTLGIQRSLSENRVRVWGTFPANSKGFGARLSVHKPALWAAKLFLETLKSHGIACDGNAQTSDARVPVSERFDPNQAHELAFVSSKPLREIIKETNKESINLYAELILRTLGRERAALVSNPAPTAREPGDDETGLSIIKLWLNRSQISTSGLALHDGSGLSRLNLVTPRSLSQLLAVLYRSPQSQVFRESLPLSGRDGTLGSRLPEYTDRVSAKTGYLTYDSALSGYVTTSGGEVFAFSIICNDETGRASSGRLIDQIVSLLAAHPAISSEKAR